jgi:hypothetical protein
VHLQRSEQQEVSAAPKDNTLDRRLAMNRNHTIIASARIASRVGAMIATLASMLALALANAGCESHDPSTVTMHFENRYEGCSPMKEWNAELTCGSYQEKRVFSESSACVHDEVFQNVPATDCTIVAAGRTLTAEVKGGTRCTLDVTKYSQWQGGVVPAPKWDFGSLECD